MKFEYARMDLNFYFILLFFLLRNIFQIIHEIVILEMNFYSILPDFFFFWMTWANVNLQVKFHNNFFDLSFWQNTFTESSRLPIAIILQIEQTVLNPRWKFRDSSSPFKADIHKYICMYIYEMTAANQTVQIKSEFMITDLNKNKKKNCIKVIFLLIIWLDYLDFDLFYTKPNAV